MAMNPPAHAASVVFAATLPMPIKSIAESVLPGLNPYQPNHKLRPPEHAMVKSCGIIGPPPSRLKRRPRRGPSTIAPAKAINPPMLCTTVEPAKSWKLTPEPRRKFPALPMLARNPSAPQAQWPMIGYMKPETAKLYSRSPIHAVRPIIAPEVMVEQVSAKANWKSQYARNATPVDSYVAGASLRKNQCIPIHPFPWLNMKANPQA